MSFRNFLNIFFSKKVDDHKKFLNKQRQTNTKKCWNGLNNYQLRIFFSVRETSGNCFMFFLDHIFCGVLWDFFFFFFSHIFNISVCFFLLNIYTITQRFEVHRFFFTELPLFSRKRIPFVFLAKHRFEIFFEKSGFYHNVWGCFFSREKGKSGYDGTDD